MENTISRQRMALPPACAQVSELLPTAVTKPAHVLVGYAGAAYGAGAGAAMTEATLTGGFAVPQLARRVVQVQGTTVSNAQPSVIGTDPVGGVRGIPPRGWPV